MKLNPLKYPQILNHHRLPDPHQLTTYTVSEPKEEPAIQKHTNTTHFQDHSTSIVIDQMDDNSSFVENGLSSADLMLSELHDQSFSVPSMPVPMSLSLPKTKDLEAHEEVIEDLKQDNSFGILNGSSPFKKSVLLDAVQTTGEKAAVTIVHGYQKEEEEEEVESVISVNSLDEW